MERTRPTSDPNDTNVSAQTVESDAAPGIWGDVLDRSERELAAGKTVDGGPLMRRLDESIARLEAKKAGARRR